MAEPFQTFTSRMIPLPAENVDTDQIVPARYLKVTDKDGLAEALFHDWRFAEDGRTKEPPFVVDPFAKVMLLAGTDELGYLLGRLADIDAWDASHPARIDTRLGTPA